MSTGRRRRTDDEDSEREESDDDRDSTDEASVESTMNNAEHNKLTDQISSLLVSNYEAILNCDEIEGKVADENDKTAVAANSTKSKAKITTRPLPIKKDPAFVPRSGQFFLHDDREDAVDNKKNSASERHVSKSSARLKKSEDMGSWKHDKFDQMAPNSDTARRGSGRQSKQTDQRTQPPLSKQQSLSSQNHQSFRSQEAPLLNSKQVHQSPQKPNPRVELQPAEHHRVPRRSTEERRREQQQVSRQHSQLQHAELSHSSQPRSTPYVLHSDVVGGDLPALSASVAGLRVAERQALQQQQQLDSKRLIGYGGRSSGGPPAISYSTEEGISSGNRNDSRRSGSLQNRRSAGHHHQLPSAVADSSQRVTAQNASHNQREERAKPRSEINVHSSSVGGSGVSLPTCTDQAPVVETAAAEPPTVQRLSPVGPVSATQAYAESVERNEEAVNSIRVTPPVLDSAVLNPTARIFQPTPGKAATQDGSGIATVSPQMHALPLSVEFSPTALAHQQAYSGDSASPRDMPLPVYGGYYSKPQQQQQYPYAVVGDGSGYASHNGRLDAVQQQVAYSTNASGRYSAASMGYPGLQQHYVISAAEYVQQPQTVMVDAYGQPMMYGGAAVYADGSSDMQMYGGGMVAGGSGGTVWYSADQQALLQQAQSSDTMYYAGMSAAPTQDVQQQYSAYSSTQSVPPSA